MKNIVLKITLVVFSMTILLSCSEDETALPTTTVTISNEDFQTAVNSTDLDIASWTNFNETGAWKWREKTFSGNGYAEFSAFNSGSTNIAWLISPEINLDVAQKKGVAFEVAQHHLDVDSPNNSLQVFISTNYDGTNVLAATWTPLQANIPTKSVAWYQFVASNIDLSAYNGKAHIAFKFKGSGTDTTLDGAFQVDNFLFYKLNN
ncbi:MAG: hypothetical protein RI980_163 [Bacteroidota bacterium]